MLQQKLISLAVLFVSVFFGYTKGLPVLLGERVPSSSHASSSSNHLHDVDSTAGLHQESKSSKGILDLPFERQLKIMKNLGAVDIARMGASSEYTRGASMQPLSDDPKVLVETMLELRHAQPNNDAELKLTAAFESIRDPKKIIDILREMDSSSINAGDANGPFKVMRNVLKEDKTLTLIGESITRTVKSSDENGHPVTTVVEDLEMKLDFAEFFLKVYGGDKEMFQALKSNEAMKTAFSITEDSNYFSDVLNMNIESLLKKDLSPENLLIILKHVQHPSSQTPFISYSNKQKLRDIVGKVDFRETLSRNPTLSELSSVLSVFSEHNMPPESLRALVFDPKLVQKATPTADFNELNKYVECFSKFKGSDQLLEPIIGNLKTCLANTKQCSLYLFDNVSFNILYERSKELAPLIFNKEVMELLVERSSNNKASDLSILMEHMSLKIDDWGAKKDEIFTAKIAKELFDRNSKPSFWLDLMRMYNPDLPKTVVNQLYADDNRITIALEQNSHFNEHLNLLVSADKYGNPHNVIEKALLKMENIEKVWKSDTREFVTPRIEDYLIFAQLMKKYSPPGSIKQLFTEEKLNRIDTSSRLRQGYSSENYIAFMRLLHEEGVPNSLIENKLFVPEKVVRGPASFKDFVNYVSFGKEIGISSKVLDETVFDKKYLTSLIRRMWNNVIDYFRAASLVPTDKASLFMNDKLAESLRSVETSELTREDSEKFFELKQIAERTPNFNRNVLAAFNDANVISKFQSKKLSEV